MRVKIKGKAKTFTHRILREALWFFADETTTQKDFRKLRITLRFKRKIVPSSAWVYKNKARHSFTIEASTRSGPYQLLQNLAHEFIHIKQYLDGKMTEKRMGTAWNGRVYKGDFHRNNDAYFNAPWEVDANGRYYWLYKRCRLHLIRCGYKMRKG